VCACFPVYARRSKNDQTRITQSLRFQSHRSAHLRDVGGRRILQAAQRPNKPGFDPNVKPFVISIPPPNVTGELHLGHAMFVSVEDLMIRYHRMKGYSTLWVPGTDHAGIATQLHGGARPAAKTEEVTREELGREEFVKRTWEWKRKYGNIITTQIRRLGASCDWDRERFTLDDGLSRAVREAFVRLYEKGLIYRGPRLINWSPGLKTAVSDLEVEYSEEEATLYYFKYMLSSSSTAGQSEANISPSPPSAPKPSWAIRLWRCILTMNATKNSSAKQSSCRF
jgi:valyl-tRNA synthetase